MAENMRATVDNDSLPIPLVIEDSIWASTPSAAYCWFDNDSMTYAETYGALYNFYAGTNICPSGWVLPSDTAWAALVTYLDSEKDTIEIEYESLTAGGSMKEKGLDHWMDPNTGATNLSGFNGLPGAGRYLDGFSAIGRLGNWWTSTESNPFAGILRYLRYDSTLAGRTFHGKNEGFSIRCIKK